MTGGLSVRSDVKQSTTPNPYETCADGSHDRYVR